MTLGPNKVKVVNAIKQVIQMANTPLTSRQILLHMKEMRRRGELHIGHVDLCVGRVATLCGIMKAQKEMTDGFTYNTQTRRRIRTWKLPEK